MPASAKTRLPLSEKEWEKKDKNDKDGSRLASCSLATVATTSMPNVTPSVGKRVRESASPDIERTLPRRPYTPTHRTRETLGLVPAAMWQGGKVPHAVVSAYLTLLTTPLTDIHEIAQAVQPAGLDFIHARFRTRSSFVTLGPRLVLQGFSAVR